MTEITQDVVMILGGAIVAAQCLAWSQSARFDEDPPATDNDTPDDDSSGDPYAEG